MFTKLKILFKEKKVRNLLVQDRLRCWVALLIEKAVVLVLSTLILQNFSLLNLKNLFLYTFVSIGLAISEKALPIACLRGLTLTIEKTYHPTTS